MDAPGRQLDPAAQRRFDALIEAIVAGDVDEDDLLPEDLDLLRELYGERVEELQDLFDHLRRMHEAGP